MTTFPASERIAPVDEFRGLVAALVLASTMAFASGQNAGVSLPWAADFSSAKIEPSWILQCDSSNSVKIARAGLEFRAHANTRAHVEHELGADLIRVSCALKSEEASTPSLLCLRWDDSNFIEFGINSPVVGHLNVREVLATYPHDYDLGIMPTGKWQFVAIELGRNCIRYLASQDGKTYQVVHISPRPARLASAPKLLAMGQDTGGKVFPRPTPWIAAPSSEPVGFCWIRDLRIKALNKSRLTATTAERRQLADAELDLVGEQELASPRDPTFDSVSRHFPAMKWPREIVGVKDNPHEIGIAPDGSLQLSEGIANYQKPTAYFQIGDYRFGSDAVPCAKTLLNGWMPIVVASDSHDGLDLEETIFGWSKNFSPDEDLIGYIQFRVTNVTDSTRPMDLKFVMYATVFKDRGEEILPMIPDNRELWKESDGSADGYYGIIASCLLEIGLPPSNAWAAKLIVNALQRRGGLVAGICQFHRMTDHAYTYGYWLNCLQHDKVRRAILGFYGALAYGMSRGTHSAVECTCIRTGENYWTLPHTYSNTQQLRSLRNMLVREDGDTLWLGQAIPRPWLAPGKRVSVKGAPTRFGPVSYSIAAERDGSMRVELLPPVRHQPKEILLRLRDLEQRRIARVKSVGEAKIKFSNETVLLADATSPVALDVAFK